MLKLGLTLQLPPKGLIFPNSSLLSAALGGEIQAQNTIGWLLDLLHIWEEGEQLPPTDREDAAADA